MTGAAATLIVNVDIYTPETHIPGGSILIEDGRIAAIGRRRAVSGMRRAGRPVRIFDFRGHIAVPGFIDIHLHGASGADFMDASPEAAARILKTHLKKGTTAALPTLMTAAHEEILRAIEALRRLAASDASGLPEILGLHLEGPYIAKEKRGAQPEKNIRTFRAEELREYLRASRDEPSGRGVKIMTLAPEAPKAASLIQALRRAGIIAAAGHSNATFEQGIKGIALGIGHGTHLFNAMSGFFHRDPGLAGALLLDDRVTVELIADGLHLHPAVLRLVARLKPPDKVILVTDATRRAGQSTRPLRTADGKLYGSAMTLDIAVRNMVRWTGLPLTEILPMATSNPASRLGMAGRKGRLAKGQDADIVIMDAGLNIKRVFLKGCSQPFRKPHESA